MTTFIDQQVERIDGLIKQAEAEVAKLRAARGALTNGHGTRAVEVARLKANPSQAALEKLAAGRQAKVATTTRKRAPRGERGAQMLAMIEAHPGIKTAEAAERIGINPSQAYKLVKRLSAAGTLVKRGDGWALASD